MFRKAFLPGLASLLLAGVVFEEPDAGGGPAPDAGASVDERTTPTLGRALVDLDPKDDSVWTQGGEPLLENLEAVTGLEKVTRDDVNQLTNGTKRSDDWAAVLAETVDLAPDPDDEFITTAEAEFEKTQAGAEDDDETEELTEEEVRDAETRHARKSSLDVKKFTASDEARGVQPGQVIYVFIDKFPQSATVDDVYENGQIDATVGGDGDKHTGVEHKSVIGQLPADDPARNLPFWSFTKD